MNGVNKTLYIPLYGKSAVSKKGIILKDTKAEMIWEKEGFALKGKAKSKWLTYYMGMRAAVFDKWVQNKINTYPEAVVLHIGCGMDSRIDRIGKDCKEWYDIDFPEVIEERRKYYEESVCYHMISADARETDWIAALPSGKRVIVIMEGISMYLQLQELSNLLSAIKEHFNGMDLLMDCYTEFAAKASKYKNPINEMGVSTVYGLDDATIMERKTGLRYLGERSMTPEEMISELQGFERTFFRYVLAGKVSKKMYRLYEYTD